MDIKDLLVSKPSPHLKGDRRLSAYSQPDSPPRRPRAPSTALDFPLPSTNPGHPILPSPAPTISYAPEGTYRHLSPPYHLKAECPEYLHHPWDRHTPHSNYFSNYQNHEHSIHYATPPVSTYSPSKRALSLEDPNSKRQKKGKGPNQKWDAEEDARIIELRGSGMKWGDISKNLPGRTEIACRLHYQNYLEKRGQWDEEKKTKLARVYDRYLQPFHLFRLQPPTYEYSTCIALFTNSFKDESRTLATTGKRTRRPLAFSRSYALDLRRTRNGSPCKYCPFCHGQRC